MEDMEGGGCCYYYCTTNSASKFIIIIIDTIAFDTELHKVIQCCTKCTQLNLCTLCSLLLGCRIISRKTTMHPNQCVVVVVHYQLFSFSQPQSRVDSSFICGTGSLWLRVIQQAIKVCLQDFVFVLLLRHSHCNCIIHCYHNPHHHLCVQQ